MDPWANYTQHYSRLRAAGNHQMNQLNQLSGLNVSQTGHQLNVNDHLGIGMSANAGNQSMQSMSSVSHYGSSAAAHPWLFSSHGLNAGTHQSTNHDTSSFNASPFLHHPSYESTFLSAPFQSKANYLQSAANQFFNHPMKKADMSNDMSNLRNAAYCSPMNMPGMGVSGGPPNINNMATDANYGLTTGSIFSSHLTPSSLRHHPNLMATSTSSGPFGILPHEAVNVMNSGTANAHSSHSHSSHTSHHTNSSHSKSSNDTNKHQHYHHHHKSSSSMSNMPRVDNTFPNIMPPLPPPQSSHSISSRNQASFDPTVSAKITSHHHHSQTDPYTSFSMAAAVHAMNSDYASMQQTRYASAMPTSNQHSTPFTTGNTSRTSYPSVGFATEPRSRDLLTTSSLLQSSKQGSNNSCNSRNMSAMNASYLSANCGMMMNAMSMNATAVNNYSPSPAHNVNNAVTNNLTVNSSASRSSSSASNHALQQGNDSSSCSYGYGSPATNLPQSPFQQQPQRSNSSQGTPTASAAAQPSAQDYTSYGTSQGFPSLGTQTPTPAPGYPTPPSSVGQSHVSQTPNTQPTSHEEQVSHYPQLTPQTPSSQSASFSANYNTNFSNTKLNANSSRTPESIIPNSSSCMVAAAAAVASLNNSQNNAVVTQRASSAYLISGTNLHESDAESCLSNIVNVNSLSDSISDAKLANSQMNSSNGVIGHQSEPTLNSVFSSQDIDFPSISFPVNDETTNNYANSVKLEQSSYNKKKSKNGKKSKKKDKNKGIGISVDPNNAFSGYHYPHPPQPQYQSAYPTITNSSTNAYMMPTNIHQQSQQNHNVLANNTNSESEQNTETCYDMQYQHHNHALTQHSQVQQQQQQQEAVVSQASSHPQEHELLQQIPHDTLQQSVQPVQSQHQIMESVMTVQTQPQTQPQPQTVTEKQQTFPTIDDELSFLTEPPNDCVSMETQTPDIQLDAQNNVDVNNVTNAPNLCSERSELSPLTNNSNSNHGNSSSQTSGFLKSYMSFISDSSRLSPSTPSTTKEKKKRKHKELNENKVKSNANLFNGQKSKNNKKSKTDIISDDNNSEFVDFNEQRKKNNYLMNEITPKLMSGENIANKSKTGDNRENYESKFFKRRPSNNVISNNTNTAHVTVNEVNSRNETKTNKKRKQNKIDTNSMPFNTMQSMHDEYEFPDSPLTSNTHSAKKQRKSSSSENNSKKQKHMPTFEKITTPSININFKKSTNKKSITNQSPVVTQQTKSQTKSSVSNNTNNNIKNESVKETVSNVTNSNSNANANASTISEKVQSFHQQQANKIQDILKQQTQTQTQPQPQTQPLTNHISHLNNGQKLNNVPNKKQTLSQPLANKKNNATKANSCSVSTSLQTVSTQQTAINITSNANANNVLTNNVTNNLLSVNCNTTQSIGMQSAGTNTPRRRSQDKKASTIREGLMRTGDFVVSMEESQFELPVIWRIEGKSLLQRFEPQDQEGSTVYINTSSYSAWNPTVRQRYTGVDVRIMGCSRTRIVVEKLGLTQNNPNAVNGSATIERVSGYNRSSSSSSNSSTFQHQENFEVFIQTLISQALDPNFISEIVKENDEYFLSHVQAIDDFCSRKKSRFFSKVKWEANIVKLVETYPLFTVTPQDNSGDLRCRLCHDNWSTQLIQFDGEPYHQMTLDAQTVTDVKQTKPAACDSCTEKIVLYSNLHHQKYNFFLKCKTKVEDMRGGDENKESHVILEQCLQDNEWINTLFKQLEDIWLSCDKIR